MTLKLLTEHHLEFLSLKGGCTGSSESTHAKMPHCWKSHFTAQFIYNYIGNVRMIRRACASAQVPKSICCSHTGIQSALLRKLTFLALIALRAIAALNDHAEVFSGKRGLNFGLSLHLHPYFLHRSNEGYCKSEQLHRPVWAFIARQSDMRYIKFSACSCYQHVQAI